MTYIGEGKDSPTHNFGPIYTVVLSMPILDLFCCYVYQSKAEKNMVGFGKINSLTSVEKG